MLGKPCGTERNSHSKKEEGREPCFPSFQAIHGVFSTFNPKSPGLGRLTASGAASVCVYRGAYGGCILTNSHPLPTGNPRKDKKKGKLVCQGACIQFGTLRGTCIFFQQFLCMRKISLSPSCPSPPPPEAGPAEDRAYLCMLGKGVLSCFGTQLWPQKVTHPTPSIQLTPCGTQGLRLARAIHGFQGGAFHRVLLNKGRPTK